jgi:hypothetical protein
MRCENWPGQENGKLARVRKRITGQNREKEN